MQRLVASAAMGLLISAWVGNYPTWALQGITTAPPPGAPNTPGTAGTTRSPQPAGTARTPRAAGGPSSPGTTQSARPATRLGVSQPSGVRTDSGVIFGQQGFNSGFNNSGVNNTGSVNTGISGNRFGGGTTQMMFERNAEMFNRSDASGVGNPASAIPGRPNMSGGSTSRTLRPGARIAGDPNNTSSGPGSAPFSPRPDINRNLFLDGFVSGLNVPLTPVAPIVPFGTDVQSTVTTDVVPAAPPTQVVPVIVTPAQAQATGRNKVDVAVQTDPQQPLIPQEGVATATAYPTRNPTATGDATVTAVPPAAIVTVEKQVVEVPTGASTTTYRGAPSATTQRSAVTFSYPGYRQWQGYYWYHNPAAGWHYWDGQRWVQFISAQN